MQERKRLSDISRISTRFQSLALHSLHLSLRLRKETLVFLAGDYRRKFGGIVASGSRSVGSQQTKYHQSFNHNGENVSRRIGGVK
jgi:protein involved in ribonucleotide reduction